MQVGQNLWMERKERQTVEWFAAPGPRSEDSQEHMRLVELKFPVKSALQKCRFILWSDKGSPPYGPNIIWVKSTLTEKG